jgi:hypothetical protein
MVTRSTLRSIRHIAAEAGAEGFEIVRENKHVVVDYLFPTLTPPRVRITMAATLSDNRRGLLNQIADLKRAIRSN